MSMEKKILVVDDDVHLLRALESRLRMKGYAVVTGQSGKEALERVRDEKPDLIILDIIMPQPDGFKVCYRLKNDPAHAHIPIILLTVKTTESDEFWSQQLGADEFMTKPYNPDYLMDVIEKLLNRT